MIPEGSTSSTARSLFEYPVLPDGQATRLIKLIPGISGDGIECDLAAHHLENIPPYEALSYTWGNPEKAHTISMNGHPFGITENVYTFLKRYRHETESRTLWIDGICINQSDDEEKTAQVKMMGDIYSAASRTVVWLGDCDSAKMAVDLVKELAPAMSSIDPFWIGGVILLFIAAVWKDLEPRLTDRGRENLAIFLQGAMSRTNRIYSAIPWSFLGRVVTPWNSIKSLFSRSTPDSKGVRLELFSMLLLFKHTWFERVWIIQEVVLAKNVTVLYGSEEISWDTLHYVIMVLSMIDLGVPEWTSPLSKAEGFMVKCCLSNSMFHVDQMGQMRSLNNLIGVKSTFDQLMRRFITCRATCPKDKIFALLALSDEAEEDKRPSVIWPSVPAKIDYSKTKTDRQVFTEAARNMLFRESSPYKLPLFLLPFAGTGFGPRLVDDLPSWVPDWSGRGPTGAKITTLAYHLGGETLSYRASGPASDPVIYNSPKMREELCNTQIGFPLQLLNMFGMPDKVLSSSPYVFPGPVSVLDSIQLKTTILVDTVAHLTKEAFDPDFFDNEGTSYREENPFKNLRDVFKTAWNWLYEAQSMASAHAPHPYPCGTSFQGSEEAYKRTIIGDRTPTRHPAPLDFLTGKEYKMFEGQHEVVYARLIGYDLGVETNEDIKHVWPDMWDGSLEGDGDVLSQVWIQNTWLLPYGKAIRDVCGGRKFMVTKMGRIGVVPPETRVGDEVRIVMGAQTPFVMRPIEGSDEDYREKCFELVGECYLHGMMDGELVTEENLAKILTESIILV
ncbi:HET-domain-containing protein [Stipitochalara longipes BDJ]|nr:HET-domain-containing protein [Stipitochalara longipes BDJ]